MRVQVPTLINVHCIVHCETLDAGDTTRNYLEFQLLNHFANKVYEWVGRSTNRHNEHIRLLGDIIEEDYVVGPQIHIVRWVSRGTIMTRTVQCMPTSLALSINEELDWYEIMCSFKFHF